MKKNIQDIKKEYGLVLRHIGGGQVDGIHEGYWLYLENIDTEEKFYIVKDDEVINQEAYDYVKSLTVLGFRDKTSIDCYDNYIGLFDILKIIPRFKIRDLTDKSIAQLVRDTRIPRTTIADIINNKTELKNTSLENAIAIAKALEMNVDGLYKILYGTNLKGE